MKINSASFLPARRTFVVVLLSMFAVVGGSLRAATIVFPDTINTATWQTDYDTAQVNVVLHPNFYSWGGGYNDLASALYTTGGAAFKIDFVALGGSQVTLQSFDLGNWLGAGDITQYRVYDLSDLINPVVSVSGLNVVYDEFSHPTFNVNLSSLTGLRLEIGPDMYNIGLNNIVLNSTPANVPDGGSSVIMLAAACGALGLLRRKFSRG